MLEGGGSGVGLAQGVGLDARTWLLVAVSQILCVLIYKLGVVLLHT